MKVIKPRVSFTRYLNFTGALSRQPIPVSALSAHIEQMHTNENCGFGEEYRVWKNGGGGGGGGGGGYSLNVLCSRLVYRTKGIGIFIFLLVVSNCSHFFVLQVWCF